MISEASLGSAVGKRNHHATLDGLPGFVALSIVLVHFGHWMHTLPSPPTATLRATSSSA
jgi:hypothetical protein